MQRRAINILIVVLVLAVLTAGGFGLYWLLQPKIVHGEIDFGTKYYLTDIRDNVFDNVTYDANSYFLINDDQKTGELHLIGLPDNKINFIVTNYQIGTTTTLDIEFIYKDELKKLSATSDDNGICIKQVQPSRVDITQEHPDDTTYLEYLVTILIFQKEVAWLAGQN